MAISVFAQKLGMTHIYDDKHRHIPVTILKVTPQAITGLRTPEKDGYSAIQIGTAGRKHVNKPQSGELKKLGIDLNIAHRKEIRLTDDATDAQASIGQILDATLFAPGDKIQVTSTSKGKGFAGTIKRHNFSRGPETHGSKNVRQPGSIGGGYPQRVVLGKKMAGHMGSEQVTTKSHRVMAINAADQTIAISGPVAGPNRCRVFIHKIEK